jgi:preprotein translocase subunit YajC
MPSAPALSAPFTWNFGTLAQGAAVMPGNPAQSPAPGTTSAPGTAPPGGGPTQQPQAPFGSIWLIFLVFIVVMVVSQIMAGRRERKRRDEMMRGLAKHDKVMTAGGIIGTIVEFRGDDAVVLKVDENSNTRITFARSAIQQVLKSSNSAAAGQQPSVEVRPANQSATKV